MASRICRCSEWEIAPKKPVVSLPYWRDRGQDRAQERPKAITQTHLYFRIFLQPQIAHTYEHGSHPTNT